MIALKEGKFEIAVFTCYIGKKLSPSYNPMRKKVPLLALLTDFGVHDHYVGTMKGVILSINPQACIVDISHDVEPQNVSQAGYLLWSSYRYFPSGTIFVCVVDPGVGSSRPIIAVRTEHHVFIAPENGLLDYILAEEEIKKAVRVEYHSHSSAQKYLLQTISSSFHGRDVFAPLAAHLSLGISLTKIGSPVKLPDTKSLFVNLSSSTDRAKIIHIDHFGNLITNIRVRGNHKIFDSVSCILGKKSITRWIRFYDEAPSNSPCLIVGSSNLIEIVVKNNNAAKLLSARVGMNVHLHKKGR